MSKILMGKARAFLSVLAVLAIGTAAHAAPALTHPAAAFDQAVPKSIVKAERGVKRAKTVRVDRAALEAARDSLVRGGAAQMLDVELFDGEVATLALTGTDSLYDGKKTYRGHVVGRVFSSVSMVQSGDIVAANLVAPGFVYQIRASGSGLHEVREIDQSRFVDHGALEPIPVNLPAVAKDAVVASDSASQIDVMVAYTAAARVAAGGTTEMETLIALGIAETNDAYAASGVTQRLRMVHSVELTYVDSGNMSTDLTRLQATADGFMDEVHALRDTYGADFVSLWVENGGGSCGIGYLMQTVTTAFAPNAFSVVARDCATGYYSFGHELGHNMGLAHDAYVGGSAGAYAYARGYVDLTNRFRTVMAYDNQCVDTGPSCTRIKGFANQALPYLGFAMGNASADTATALNTTAPTTANFRQAVVDVGITVLTASAATSNPGTSVTFTATIAPSDATGTVAFFDNGSAIVGCGLTTVTAGVATCATSALPSGPRSITAVYSGDVTYAGSTSNTLVHTVNAVASTTTLTAAGSTSTFGQSFTFTATVTAGSGGTPTGTITFKDGGAVIAGCSALAMGSGAASCNTTALAVGSHTITAEYAGNFVHLASTSAGRSHTVSQATTTTTITASGTSSNFGVSFTFTATVTSAGGTPTGSVTFKDGGTAIGTCTAVAMSGINASCAVSTLAVGAHTITAEYDGSTSFAPSASTGRAHTVNAASTTTALSAAATTSGYGTPFTFTATVTSAGGTPGGTITFRDLGVDIGGCVGVAMTGNTATCTVGTLSVGAHTITAVYSGNASFTGSTSAGRAHTITVATTTTTLSASGTTSVYGSSFSFTATVTSPGGTPPGSVTFKDSGIAITGCISLALTAGSATCTTTLLNAGNRSITADYAATGNFAASTSLARAHTVTPAATTTTLTSDGSSTTYGAAVVFTATVTSAGGTPTGSVAFKDGATTIATCTARPLSVGVATCSVNTLTVGSHSMTAVFAATSAFATSTSSTLAHTVTQATTTTTLDAAITSTTFGQSVTFVATVASPGGVPTGTVIFRNGGTAMSPCTAVSISSGTASCTITTLPVGTHSITADYQASTNFSASSSAARTHAVSQATTTVSITGPGVSSTFGQSFTFTANVSSSGGMPTGTVIFRDGGTIIGSCSAVALSGGNALCAISTLAVGAHSITAEYSGSASFLGSTSVARDHTVNLAPTTTAVTAPGSTSSFGSLFTFTATVTSTGGTPTGTITFRNGGVDIPTCVSRPMTSGAATCALSNLPVGAHTITAEYSGATSFLPSTSVVRNHTVNPGITSTTFSQSAAASTFGSNVTFSATVTSAGGTPTGTVTFKDGGTDIPSCSTQPLSAGVATCVMNTLALGPHVMTASYVATTNFAASNSTAVTHTVNGIPTTTTLTAPATSSTFGVSFTFTATVTSGAGTPTGTVTFRDSGISVPGCSAMPMNASGVATCTTSALTGGSHSITGQYSGGGNFAGSTSTSRTHTINAAPTTTALTASAPTSAFGGSVTFTATVTSPNGLPAGTVAFRYGATTIPGCGAVALNAGVPADCVTTALPGGTHSITATFGGSSSFATSVSSGVTHTVAVTPTTTTLAQSAASSVSGTSVTFTATVSSASGAPTGTVAFKFGATTITACTFAPLSAGVATCTVNTLPVGAQTMTAVYAGNASHGGSTSPGLTHTVTTVAPPATATALAASPAGSAAAGQSVTLTATVTSGSGTPTGSVAFRSDGTAISGCAAATLAAGVATCTTTSLAVGARSLTAVYAGNASFQTSTSPTVAYTIVAAAAPTATALSAPSTSSSAGQLVTFTAAVTAAAGTPTGTVTFKDGAAAIAGCSAKVLVAGSVGCAVSSLATGSHSITAEYSGDAAFLASTSAPRTHTVVASGPVTAAQLLWRNYGNGDIYRMNVNGLSMLGGAVVYQEAALAWKIVGIGDMDGDGVADLLYRHDTNGEIYAITLTAAGAVSGKAKIHTEPNAAWRILHMADIDGDGRDDILWWNATTGQVYVMLMQGAAIKAQGFAYTEPNTAWRIASVGDFSGSGKQNQLLWRNTTTGEVFLQTLTHTGGGAFTQSGQMIYQEPNTAWKILGAPDLDGNGRSDILWRNETTGQVFGMLMNGGAIQSQAIIYTEPATAWKIVGFGDLDGNGRADLLWRHDTNGQVYAMLMNGLAIASQGMLYTEPDTAWKILGPWEFAAPYGGP